MRFVHISLVVFLVFCHAMPALGEEPTAYLCIPDACTGFKPTDSGKWVIERFNVEGMQYLLSEKEGKWQWQKFGGRSLTHPLSKCNTFDEYGFLICQYLMDEIRFNKKTLRFMVTFPMGYVTSDIETDKTLDDTPFIMIGTCTPL